VPLVGAADRIEHDDAVVHVPVGDVDFVGGLVDVDVRRGTEVLRVVAAAALALAADLHQKPARRRELQDVRVGVAAGAEPHLIAAVDEDAVFELRPLVVAPGTAP
jgi:hypothetical protein